MERSWSTEYFKACFLKNRNVLFTTVQWWKSGNVILSQISVWLLADVHILSFQCYPKSSFPLFWFKPGVCLYWLSHLLMPCTLERHPAPLFSCADPLQFSLTSSTVMSAFTALDEAQVAAEVTAVPSSLTLSRESCSPPGPQPWGCSPDSFRPCTQLFSPTGIPELTLFSHYLAQQQTAHFLDFWKCSGVPCTHTYTPSCLLFINGWQRVCNGLALCISSSL